MPRLSPEEIANVKKSNPGVRIHETDVVKDLGEEQAAEIGTVLVRPPKLHEYKAFQISQAMDPAVAVDGSEVLVRACMVYPSGDSIRPLLEAFPGLRDTCGMRLIKLAGNAKGAQAKKL